MLIPLRRFIVRLALLSLLVPVSALLRITPARAESPNVIIGEVAWAGSSLSTADEWIELWNLSGTAVSLDGFRLAGAGGSAGIPLGPTDTVAPFSAFLISNYSDRDAKSALAAAPDVVTTTVSLANDKLGISLVDPSGAVVDRAGNGAAPPAGSSGTPKTSMIRIVPVASGDETTAWTSATTSQNFDPDVPDRGTPGICDGCLALLPPHPVETPSPAPAATNGIEPTNAATSTEQVVTAETGSSTLTVTSTAPLDEPAVVADAASTTTEIPPSPSPVSDATAVPDAPEPILSAQNGPQQPLASFLVTGDLIAQSTTTFDASASSDPNGDPIRFTWDFGDGTSATSVQVTHAYATSGTYVVCLTASDNTFWDTASTTLTIADLAPVPPIEPPEALAITEEIASSTMDFGSSTSTLTATSTSSTAVEMTSTEPVVLATSAATVGTIPATTGSQTSLPATIRLNELFPAPVTGPEWVELAGVDALPLSTLLGWSLNDGQGAIFRFTSSAIADLVPQGPYLLIRLTGSHLNNTGDAVSLQDAAGNVIDETAYPAIDKGLAWIRSPDGAGTWTVSLTATPGETNVLTPLSVPFPVQPPAAVPAAATTASAKAIVITRTTPTKMTNLPASASAVAPNPASIQQPKTSAKNKTAKPANTKPPAMASVPKARTNTAAVPTLPATLAMLTDLPSDTRISVQGVVASVPSLLGKNTYVILSEDGRGLLVYGNNKQTTPPFGTNIRVTGKLLSNDNGIQLQLAARDRWTPLPDAAMPKPRPVDLTIPSLEDAWSLVEVTGTVTGATKQQALIDLADASIVVQIKPASGYRAERLKAGDTVHVRGLLDTRGGDGKLVVRTPDDVTIVEHAKQAVSQAAVPSPIPPWSPFGAAGATIALTKGVTVLKKIRERKRLELLLKQATENLQNS